MTENQVAQRFSRIYEIGCIACLKKGWFSECQIHHLNLGGHAGQRRRGDEFTIGLCPWHHQGQSILGFSTDRMYRCFGPSLARHPTKFRDTFGIDDELLKVQNPLIDERLKNVVGRTAHVDTDSPGK